MEKSTAVIIFKFSAIFCYIIYGSMPGKYAKLNERFGGLAGRFLLNTEYELSALLGIVHATSGTGKTCFVRQ